MRAATSHRKPISKQQIWLNKAEQAFTAAAQCEASGCMFMAQRHMREAELFERHASKEMQAA